MPEYLFELNPHDEERQRLRLIELALDEASIAHLESTGIRQGWRCLELGAGAGSIAHWMAGAVGEQGEVIAVDTNTKHVQHLSGSLLKIIQGDFLNVSLEEPFDLAHCRYVLIHNRKSQAMLSKLCSLLKPGAWLVAEEPDFTSAKLLNKGGDDSQQRVNNAICRMFEQMQLEPAYGFSLPARIAAEGLHVVRVAACIHLNRGGDPMGRMMGESTRVLRDKYIATGEANRTDIEQYIDNANNEQFWAVYYSTVSVAAIKP